MRKRDWVVFQPTACPIGAWGKTVNADEVERVLRDWIDDIVVELGLCPFAAPVLQEKGLRIQVTTTRDEEEAMSLVLAEVSALVESDDAQLTSMIVTPNLFGNFGVYLDIVEELEAVLEEVGADHLVQIASFHPCYCFEGVPVDDRANFTNRTPFPVFHLLRQEDVEEALDGWREPLKIPERNIKVLREMSQEKWNKLFGNAREAVKRMTRTENWRGKGFLILPLLLCCTATLACSKKVAPPQVTTDTVGDNPGGDVNALRAEASNDGGPANEESEAVKESKPLPRISQGLRIWDELMRLQCKGRDVGLWTPIQAMIAAHVPRAIANGPIQDMRIRTFFEQDAKDYDGTHQGLLGLDRDVAKCMARMKGWEESLRESTSWQISEAVEGRLIQSPEAISLINDVTLGRAEYPFDGVESGVEVNGRTWVRAFKKGCVREGTSGTECLALEVSCWSTGPCTGSVH